MNPCQLYDRVADLANTQMTYRALQGQARHFHKVSFSVAGSVTGKEQVPARQT
jgi:hypothetical protein